jgi:hypothetical protein
VVKKIQAHALVVEDCLGDDQPSGQCAEVDGRGGRQRDQSISERVIEDHAPFRNALGAGGTDVIGVDRLEHAGAHIAAVDGDLLDRQHDHG